MIQPGLSDAQIDVLREYVRAARKLARLVATGSGRPEDSLERFNNADRTLLKLIEVARAPALESQIQAERRGS